MSQFTTNLRLELPNFNITGWHDAVNQNFATLDTVISAGAGAIGITGLWDNDVDYVVGNRLIDTDDDSAWLCEVSHTSAVAGTFAADRAANPTFWSLLSLGLVIKGPWQVGVAYVVGDVVYSVAEHIVAACVIAHTSVHLRNDATAGNWVFIADLKASVDAAAADAAAADADRIAAAASATAASGSATAAAGSATAASGSATSASGSATTATTQASNASTSASNASTSASTASTQATNAANSASAADADRIAAEAAEAAAVTAAATAAIKSRNKIVNPSMFFSTENGTTAGTSSGYYAADQWYQGFVSNVGVFTIQLISPATITPQGARHRLRMTVTTADASLGAGEYYVFGQKIEAYNLQDFRFGTAGARQIIVRFGFRGPAGTYNIQLRNNALNRCYLSPFTISAGQANTDTLQTFVIPGDTTGTWEKEASVGVEFLIHLAGGTTGGTANVWTGATPGIIAGMSNGVGTAGAVFELFDVGMYVDYAATGVVPEWETEDIQTATLRCARYIERIHPIFSGDVTTGNQYFADGHYLPKRVFPPIFTGTNVTNVHFPATVGTLATNGFFNMTERRVANLTGTGAVFGSNILVDARL